MQAIKCEMCNSSDVIKQDGFYVCQNCGTKYTVEEARKLMIEGTVDVQGTVKVDNSAFVERYLQNARRAKQKEDWKETEKYYNMVEQNDPSNIEAIFYSSFAQVKSALLEAEPIAKRQAVFNVLKNSVSVIDDNYDNTNDIHQKLLPEIMDDIKNLKSGTIVPTTHIANYETRDNYGYGNVVDRSQIVENDSLKFTYDMIDDIFVAYMDSLANIIAEYSPEPAKKIFLENCNRIYWHTDIFKKAAPHIDGYKTPDQVASEVVKQLEKENLNNATRQDIAARINESIKTICPFYMSYGSFLYADIYKQVLNNLPRIKELDANEKAIETALFRRSVKGIFVPGLLSIVLSAVSFYVLLCGLMFRDSTVTILSVIGFIGYIVGIICAIICKISIKNYKANGGVIGGRIKAGKILSTIGIILSIVFIAIIVWFGLWSGSFGIIF